MEQELIDYGLSEKEAKLYLLCLKTGESTASRLIHLSGLARGTAYDILDRLKAKGLVSTFIKGKVTYFRANDPDILIKTLDEKKINIEKVIPNLKKIQKTVGKKINIEVFEGVKGTIKVWDDAISNSKNIIVMANEHHARILMKHHPEHFRIKRLKRKVKIRNLLEGSLTARKLKDDKYSKVRHLEELKDLKEALVIYNNITAHMIIEEPITTIKVTSKEYTKTQRLMYDNLWKKAKK